MAESLVQWMSSIAVHWCADLPLESSGPRSRCPIRDGSNQGQENHAGMSRSEACAGGVRGRLGGVAPRHPPDSLSGGRTSGKPLNPES